MIYIFTANHILLKITNLSQRNYLYYVIVKKFLIQIFHLNNVYAEIYFMWIALLRRILMNVGQKIAIIIATNF